MKRSIFLSILTLASAFVANCEPLFPFFVDLVGNYTEKKSGDITLHVGNTNYGGYDAAKEFLESTLPENYGVMIDENKFGNRMVRTYSSTMENGNTSVIYFITEGNDFRIEYAEGPFIAVLPFYE